VDVIGPDVGRQQVPPTVGGVRPDGSEYYRPGAFVEEIGVVEHFLTCGENAFGVGFQERAADSIVIGIDGAEFGAVEAGAVAGEGDEVGQRTLPCGRGSVGRRRGVAGFGRGAAGCGRLVAGCGRSVAGCGRGAAGCGRGVAGCGRGAVGRRRGVVRCGRDAVGCGRGAVGCGRGVVEPGSVVAEVTCTSANLTHPGLLTGYL